MKILVIDDNADAAESLRMLLELADHTVSLEHTGEAAVQRKPVDFDAVICDIGLPGALDGMDVARTLRAAPEGESLKLIALSGHAQDEDKHASLRAGFDAYLVKPASLEDIQAALNDSLKDVQHTGPVS